MSVPIDVLAALTQPDKLHAAIKRLRSFETLVPIKLSLQGQVYPCAAAGNFIALRLWTPDAGGTSFLPPPFMYRLRVQLTSDKAERPELEFVLMPGDILSIPFDGFRARLEEPYPELSSKFGWDATQIAVPYLFYGWSMGEVHLPHGGAPSPVQEIGVAGWYSATFPFGGIAPLTNTPLPPAAGSAAGDMLEYLRITNQIGSPGAITLEDLVAGTLEAVAPGTSVPLTYAMDLAPLSILTGAAAGAYDYVLHYGVRY